MPCPLNAGESIANFLPASGNPGVVQAIENTPGAIGYVEAANAASAINGSNINFATVNGKDPIKDLPAAATTVVGAATEEQGHQRRRPQWPRADRRR